VMFVGLVTGRDGMTLLECATVAKVQANQIWRMKMKTKIEERKFPQILHYMAMEYSSYFTGGLSGIDEKRQIRLNEIEDKVREMNIDWEDWTELVLAHFGGIK
jgi:hypothetical protein